MIFAILTEKESAKLTSAGIFTTADGRGRQVAVVGTNRRILRKRHYY